jgi:LmbE family N-acetylglucosaminyl deacetylase
VRDLIGGDAPARLMVVVAHPDDETFGCGSLLLHAAALGVDTAVCCATRGEAGEPAPGSGVLAEDLAVVREQELREAAGLLGVRRVDVLDFTDSGMTGDADPSTLVGAPFEVVVTAVRACLDAVRPQVVVTLDASDGHRDHARIRDATLAAVEEAQWQVDRVYLQCLPQSLMRQWLEHVARSNPGSGHLDVEVPGTPDHLVTTLLDTSAHLPERERAMAAHRSQVSPYDGLPEPLRSGFLGTDRLRRVVPPWPDGAPVETRLFGDVAVSPPAASRSPAR